MKPLSTGLRFLARDKLSVFLFHKVPAVADPIVPQDLDIKGFKRMLDFVGEHFKVIPIDDAVQSMQVGKLPSRAACITFDDGYPGWIEGAVAELERRNFHATFYITSGQFNGVPMWHERVAHAVKSAPGPTLALVGFGLPALSVATLHDRQTTATLVETFLKYQPLDIRDKLLVRLENVAGVQSQDVPRMNLQDLRALYNKGFGVGAHTALHPILTLCDEDQAFREIGLVREEISALVGGSVHSFAYPNGRPVTDFNADHIRMVQRAGYRHAVTTQRGWATKNTPVFQIPRFTPWGPEAGHMALQLGRNLLTPPRLFSQASTQLAPQALPNPALPPAAPAQPVRVMFVENGAGFGGAVIALQTLLVHLPAASIQCDVVSNLPVANFAALASVRSHRLIEDHIYNFRTLSNRILVAGWGVIGKLLLFCIGRMDDLFNRLPYFVRLLVHAIRVRPDIIHGNNEPNSNREAMFVAKVLGKPYVQHLRGPLGMSRHTPWLMARPDVFVPVSRWLGGDLLMAGVAVDRIRQIYDALDISAVRSEELHGKLREEFAIPANAIVIAMVGMLVPWKGQQLFIEAVKAINPTGRPLICLIVGGTPERADLSYEADLREQVLRTGQQGRIIFLGRRNDIPSILPEIDIVVSASLEPEPLGLVMLEAMASGPIFVAPAFGAATEVVIDGYNGFLFAPGSAASLTQKLIQAIHCLDNRSDICARALESVQTQFSGKRCAQATLALHRSIFQGTV